MERDSLQGVFDESLSGPGAHGHSAKPPAFLRAEMRNRAAEHDDALRRLIAAAAGLALAFMTVPFAYAWEVDVHYGLTRWLAIQAGYTNDQAEQVAQGDQGVDDSWITGPVHGTIVAACVGRDPAGSDTVHDHHFPSKSDPPADPAKRSVTSGEVWRDGKRRDVPFIDGSEASLLSLGRYLHAQQDSWSHQGEADVPEFCSPRLGFGHAVSRGGWSCHLADLTYRWARTDVPAMARATYDVLQHATGNHLAKPWEDLEPRVIAFAVAQTKLGKDKWFRGEKFTNVDFLQEISLPDCEPNESCPAYPIEVLRKSWKRIVDNVSQASAAIPPEYVELFNKYLNGLTRRQFADISLPLVAKERAAAALARALHVAGPCVRLFDALVPFQFGGGLHIGSGAHQPLALCELVTHLHETKADAVSCDEAVAVVTKVVAAARGPGLEAFGPTIGNTPAFVYTAWPDDDAKQYFALARFIHLPADLLVLRAEQVGGVAKITSSIWMPSE